MGISGKSTALVLGLITIMIVMFLYSSLAPSLISSANNVTDTFNNGSVDFRATMPLSGLFSGTGVILILIAIGVFLGIMKLAMGSKN